MKTVALEFAMIASIYEKDVIVQNQRFSSQKRLHEFLFKHFNIDLKGHPIRFTKKALADFQHNEQPKPIIHQYSRLRRTKQTAIKVPPRQKTAEPPRLFG